MANGNDPANIAYIIAENGFYYVAYKEKVKVPEIVVSAKGVANGLSEEYNDGWDFGPDSYDPTSTANPPYTQTTGIMEAYYYGISTLNNIKLLGGLFYIDVPLEIGSQSTSTNAQMEIKIEGTGYMAGMGGGGTIIQISDNFDVSTNNYMIQIGIPTTGTVINGIYAYQGSFGNITLYGQSPSGNQVNIGIYINNIYGANIHNINNSPINSPAQYLIYQKGYASGSGDAPIIQNISSYGCGMHFEPNAECLYNNISVLFYNNYTLEVGCTGNNGDTGPVMTNVNLWNPDVGNDGAPAITLLGGAGTTTVISNIVIHAGYTNIPIIDASSTGSGFFLINGITLESNFDGPFVNWGDNTNPYVVIEISGINVPFNSGQPLITNTSGNTTPFTIKMEGILYTSGVPAFSSNPLASGQILETNLVMSNGTTNQLSNSTAGTTAGTVDMLLSEWRPLAKKAIITFSGYENDTTTDQTIDFPAPFSSYVVITGNSTGLTISASTTGITITAPDSTTTYSGIVIVEGY